MTNTQYFYLRRLHSLVGVIPLGAFLLEHLFTNSMALVGPDDAEFVKGVQFITSLPALPVLEAVTIFIPLLLHIVLGIVIIRTSEPNANQYRYGRSMAYSLQRISGWIALAYILFHTVTLRFSGEPTTMINGQEVEAGFFLHLAQSFQNPVFMFIYMVGGASVIFHFANGLCTFCMTWGITIGKQSQLLMSRAAAVLGVGLFIMLTASIYGMWSKYDTVMRNYSSPAAHAPRLTPKK